MLECMLGCAIMSASKQGSLSTEGPQEPSLQEKREKMASMSHLLLLVVMWERLVLTY